MDDFKREVYKRKFKKLFPSLSDILVLNHGLSANSLDSLFFKFSTNEGIELYSHYHLIRDSGEDDNIESTVCARTNVLLSRYNNLSENNVSFIKHQFKHKLYLDGHFAFSQCDYAVSVAAKNILRNSNGDSFKALRFINSIEDSRVVHDFYHDFYLKKIEDIKRIKTLRRTNSVKNGKKKKAKLNKFKRVAHVYDYFIEPDSLFKFF